MTEHEINEAINQAGPVIVKFTASWCGPCKALAPALADAARELGYPLIEVDIDQHPDLVASHRVRGVPTTMVFHGGQLRTMFTGSATRDKLIGLLKETDARGQ